MTAVLQVMARRAMNPEIDLDSRMSTFKARQRSVTVLVWVVRGLAVTLPILLWEGLAHTGVLPKFIFSAPSAILDQSITWLSDGTLVSNSLYTLSSMGVGYAAGLLVGCIGSAVLAALPRVSMVLLPFVTMANAVPRIALAPVFLAWFGIGLVSNVALVIVVVMFIVFFTVYGGLVSVNRDRLEWARSLGAGSRELWTTIRIPEALSHLISAGRATVGLAFSGAIVAEFVGGARGIGYLVSSSTNAFQASGVYAGLLATIIIAGVLDTLLRAAQKRWAHWAGN